MNAFTCAGLCLFRTLKTALFVNGQKIARIVKKDIGV